MIVYLFSLFLFFSSVFLSILVISILIFFGSRVAYKNFSLLYRTLTVYMYRKQWVEVVHSVFHFHPPVNWSVPCVKCYREWSASVLLFVEFRKVYFYLYKINFFCIGRRRKILGNAMVSHHTVFLYRRCHQWKSFPVPEVDQTFAKRSLFAPCNEFKSGSWQR